MSIVFCQGQKEVQVPCHRGFNLLGHAQMEELNIGSRCGGHGVCGGDRIRVIAGQEFLSLPNETEQKHLTPSEIQSGWRLGCQTWVNDESGQVTVEVVSHP